MKSIPSNEQIWVTIRSKDKENYHVITSKSDNRSKYYLYNCENGAVDRLGNGRSPIDLENQWPL